MEGLSFSPRKKKKRGGGEWREKMRFVSGRGGRRRKGG